MKVRQIASEVLNTGLKMLTEWAVKSECRKTAGGRKADLERRNCQLNTGAINRRIFIQSKERMGKQKVEKPGERKVRTDRKKSNSNEWSEIVFAKDEPISNVWKLVSSGSIQLKNWRKQIRKERNYQSRRFNSFKEAWFNRKKEMCRCKVWSLINEGRDLMEWCGKFNWKSGWINY